MTAAGLYLHVPFCTSVCPYCDFAVTLAGEERRRAYVRGVELEAAMVCGDGAGYDTVYLGGGTPSSLSCGQLAGLLDSMRRRLSVRQDATVFLEINPEDVTRDRAAAWKELGVGFASLGVQSFDDAALRWLGRRHTADGARRAVETLLDAGFATVSIDLIYGLDGQSAASWRRQLEEAAAREVPHLSCYQLTIHDGTVFGRRLAAGGLVEPSSETQAELLLLTHERLAELGYEGYEVSNFAASPRHRSGHNLKYWSHQPYRGLGPSAHSFDGSRRWWNLRKLRLWQRAVDHGQAPVGGSEELTPEQLALEEVMLGLRTAAGIDLARLCAKHGVDLVACNRPTVERLCASGHLVLEGTRLRPSVAGMAIADSLARSLEVTRTPGE